MHSSHVPGKRLRTGIFEGDLSIELYKLDEDKMKALMQREHVTAELERFHMPALEA